MDLNNLNLLLRCSKEYNHSEMRNREISETEWLICSYISSRKECSQDDIAESVRIDKTTIAKACQKLEEKDMIIRNTDDTDKRKKILRLTKKGNKQIEEITDLHNKWFEDIFCCLSKEEQNTFDEYCTRLLARAEDILTNNNND